MLVRGVIRYKIHNDADMIFSAFGNHVIEVGKGAIHWIDIFIVGNVVAEIDLGRGIAGSNPDGIDTQRMQITHFGADTVDVADAVVVAVGKTAGIDFVKRGVLPPRMAFGIDRLSLSGSEKGIRQYQPRQETRRPEQRRPPGHECFSCEKHKAVARS